MQLQTKEERREIKRVLQARPNPFKVGDIFYESWGYEQTNISFYEVIEVKGKSLIIHQIRQSRNYDSRQMSGTTQPLKGEFQDEEAMLKRVLWSPFDGGRPYLKSQFQGWCSPYDGKPKSFSSYA